MNALPRPADGSWWLEEAMALPAFAGEPAPPLAGDTTADVVIVGGGYTGMWSAWFLKEREPELDVVLLEQEICGGGPSGRNGGFVNGFYDDAAYLIRRFGDEGRRTVELAARSIDEIGSWSQEHGVDIWYERNGDLGISTLAGAGRGRHRVGRRGAAAGPRRHLPAAERGRGPRAVRLAGREGRPARHPRRQRPAGPAGARAARAP